MPLKFLKISIVSSKRLLISEDIYKNAEKIRMLNIGLFLLNQEFTDLLDITEELKSFPTNGNSKFVFKI